MSLAVSALVAPSRRMRLALAGYALASAGAAMQLALGGAERFHASSLLAAACLLAALVTARAAVLFVTAHHIDISGPGEIRLTVQQSMGGAGPRTLMQLLPGSTLWPGLMLLRLREVDGGAIKILAVLPDSVPALQFRQIGVALRAIARRDNKFSGKNKIH